jgi:TatA/E family protein of Tat protein translocase
MPFNIGFPEMIIILVLALIIFGPRRLPEIGGAIGKAMREFRRASTEITEELTREVELEKEQKQVQASAQQPVDRVEEAPQQVEAASAGGSTPQSAELPLGEPKAVKEDQEEKAEAKQPTQS